MTEITILQEDINKRFADVVSHSVCALDELTIEVKLSEWLNFAKVLRDDPAFQFNILLDVCGVDYLHYGLDDWETQPATSRGFSRGTTCKLIRENPAKESRFAVVYHLLSLPLNQRLRVRVFLPDHVELILSSVVAIWPAANWYEREVYDLFGILFHGHPDLRRILTDYGFQGHPFRKDFPLIGKVEARYDAALKRVVYEPVSITARVLEPKVIRKDNRYLVDREGDQS